MGIGISFCTISCALYIVFRRLHIKKQYLIYIQVLFITGILACASGYMSESKQSFIKNHKVEKNDVGQGTSKKVVNIKIPELDTEIAYTITIPEKTLTQKEIESLFSKEKKEVEKDFLGENKSLESVTKPVHLTEKTKDGIVRCKWSIDDAGGLIGTTGSINQSKIPKDGKILQAHVTLIYEKESCDYSFFFKVKRKKLTQVETIIQDINQKIKSGKKEDKTFFLPTKAAGYDLKWSIKNDFKEEIICCFGVAIAIGIYFANKEKIKKDQELRKKAFIYAYAELVSKICLLLGAGMTLRLAWEKIALTYQHQREEGFIEKQLAYEEVLLSYAKMQEGMGEIEVYELFARKCNLPKYTKLVSLLTQNIKKGQDEFLILLEKESKEAFTERKLLAKKLGEEASTKLLLPMMLMMLVVIVILIVPAIFSFQI